MQSKKHFYTNGVIDRKFSDDDIIPEGFRRGRTNGCRAFTKGLVAINNGKVCRFVAPDAPLPEGFVRGQMKHTSQHNQKISAALKGKERSVQHCLSLSLSHKQDSYKQRMTNTLIERYGVDNVFKLDSIKELCNTPEVHKKRFSTMKKNGTIKKSKLEDTYYAFYSEQFGVENVLRQYRSEDYPFACDFYIKPLELYVEINGFWTHGPHPFDANCADDILMLEEWKQLALKSPFYSGAIETWTNRDVRKLEALQNNNLNYLIIYYDGTVSTNLEESQWNRLIIK